MNRLLFLFSTAFERFGVVLTLSAMAAITVASLSLSGSIGDPGSADKTMHILAYAAAILSVAVSRSKPTFLVALGIVAWSGAIELLQPLVGREATISDLLANSVGVLLGLSLAYPLRWMLRHGSSKDTMP